MVQQLPVNELVRRYANGDGGAYEVLAKLGVLQVRSPNPSGDYAEWLVHQRLGGHRMAPGHPDYDLIDSHGRRVQVKARHIKTRAPMHVAVAASLETQAFDLLAVVFFATDWKVLWSYVLPWEAVTRLSVRYAGTNHRLRLPGTWRNDPAVVPLALAEGISALTAQPV